MTVNADSLLWTKAAEHRATLLFGHGAGVGMTSPFMEQMSERLAMRGITVARFEFRYMAARRTGGSKRPPPRADKLIGEYLAAIRVAFGSIPEGPLLIGGKSLGGRVAAMAAAETETCEMAAGVVCLGYPFHAPGNTEQIRLTPLLEAKLPALICQGDRDPFGNAAEIAGFDLPDSVSVTYLEDGDHDFKPRGRSPATWKSNLDVAADTVTGFAEAFAGG